MNRLRSFGELPTEILVQIIKQVDYTDLKNIRLIEKALVEITKDPWLIDLVKKNSIQKHVLISGRFKRIWHTRDGCNHGLDELFLIESPEDITEGSEDFDGDSSEDTSEDFAEASEDFAEASEDFAEASEDFGEEHLEESPPELLTKKHKFNYYQGSLDGLQLHWYPNGVTSYEVTYCQGVQDGPEIWYDRSGKITQKNVFVKGKLISEETAK